MRTLIKRVGGGCGIGLVDRSEVHIAADGTTTPVATFASAVQENDDAPVGEESLDQGNVNSIDSADIIDQSVEVTSHQSV